MATSFEPYTWCVGTFFDNPSGFTRRVFVSPENDRATELRQVGNHPEGDAAGAFCWTLMDLGVTLDGRVDVDCCRGEVSFDGSHPCLPRNGEDGLGAGISGSAQPGTWVA